MTGRTVLGPRGAGSPSITDEAGAARPSWAWPVIAGVVLAKSALNLAVAGRYGWHIDELYYRSTGQHPMLGYTDFPPLVPMVARLAEALFGSSLVGLRLFAVMAGAGTVVVTAAIARQLGGRQWAQGIAALAAATPTLGANAMFQTVSFDQLTWALLFLAAIRVLTLGTHNMSYAHTPADVADLLSAYDQVFPILASALAENDLHARLRCEPLKPLFKVRG